MRLNPSLSSWPGHPPLVPLAFPSCQHLKFIFYSSHASSNHLSFLHYNTSWHLCLLSFLCKPILHVVISSSLRPSTSFTPDTLCHSPHLLNLKVFCLFFPCRLFHGCMCYFPIPAFSQWLEIQSWAIQRSLYSRNLCSSGSWCSRLAIRKYIHEQDLCKEWQVCKDSFPKKYQPRMMWKRTIGLLLGDNFHRCSAFLHVLGTGAAFALHSLCKDVCLVNTLEDRDSVSLGGKGQGVYCPMW